MAQYSVYENPNPSTCGEIPFLLDVQAEVLSHLGTRVVVPLYCVEVVGPRVLTRLTPQVTFQGRALVVMIPELAGISLRQLGATAGDLLASRGEIRQALDLLLTGF